MNAVTPAHPASKQADQRAHAELRLFREQPTLAVSPNLLGHNLEAVDFVVEAMLSDLLENPKFLGPADPQTGLAPGWRPRGNHMGGVRYELTPGMSLSGNEAQLIHNFTSRGLGTILQTGRRVRQDQTYEIELWAKARHQPADLRFELAPLPSRRKAYDMVELTVDAAYWKPYRAKLTVPCDDNAAVFACSVVGEGLVWIDQIHLRPAGEPHTNQSLLRAIGELGVPVLRFPGGCQSTNYHWRHGTGPVHRRPTLYDPVSKQRACYDFGLDEYLELCANHRITPHVTVNIGSETPDDAADLARYIARFYLQRDQTPPRAYFQMGNEQYGIWETSHMTGPMYVQALRAFVPPIRQAYPDPRIIALGEAHSAGLRPELDTPWREAILDQAGELFDVLSLNRYKGQWNDTDDRRMSNVVASIDKIRSDLTELRDASRRHGPGHTVALTEWNYWLNAAHWDGQQFHEPFDTQHALFVAGMLHMMARLGADLEVSNFYHLVVAMGLFEKRGGSIEAAEGACELFQAYREALPGELLAAEVTPPAGFEPGMLDAIVLRRANLTRVFLINFHPTTPATLMLPGRATMVTRLTGQAPTAPLKAFTVSDAARAQCTLPPLTLWCGDLC